MIKLYSKLLRKYEFLCLQDASKLLLIFLWLLASTIEEDDPAIPADLDYLKSMLPIKGKIDLQPLIEYGFIEMLANCLQDASNLPQKTLSETETETETETEEEKERPNRVRFVPPSPKEVEDYGQEINFRIDGEAFCRFYESKGWMIGKNKMKCWRSAVVTWKKRDKKPENDIKRKLAALPKMEDL